MASSVSTNKLRANIAQRTYIHDPAAATTAAVVAWVDMSLFASFMAQVALVSGTGLLTARIMASASSDGSNPVEVRAHAAPTAVDAAGDQATIECSSEELAALGTDLRYVGLEVDADHADDIFAVVYTRAGARFAHDDLTPESVIDGEAV